MSRPYDKLMKDAECNSYALAEDIYQLGREDAIDEFVNECSEYENLTFANEHIERIKKIAEELKEQKNG